MDRLRRTIARIEAGESIDVDKIIDVLSYIADFAQSYADENGYLMEMNHHDIEDACDWAVSLIQEMMEEEDGEKVENNG